MMTFKNDTERKAFLEDYRNTETGWYLWKEDEELGRRMWRRDIESEESAIIVEEMQQTITWPKPEVKWMTRKYYIDTDHKRPFEDHCASKTMALTYIKQLKQI